MKLSVLELNATEYTEVNNISYPRITTTQQESASWKESNKLRPDKKTNRQKQENFFDCLL
jgi:hypothetical protein